jgi:selenide,water dikinase
LADDAAVVRFADDESCGLVLTTDVITPIVDDPATFGAIAACNALSDVYAMGGAPRFVLNLAFFPDDRLPLSVLREILRGAAEICAQAGAPVVGGHTVRDAEPKFGLAVTGEVERARIWSNTGARAGQALVLTKALGTGVIGSAIRSGSASAEEIDAAVASMTTLNQGARACARRVRVSSATDVTGFGLLGHLRNILRGSGLAARLRMDSLPALPGVLAKIRADKVPGGTRSNLRFVSPWIAYEGREDPALTLLAADAQTSGGLLLCVDPEDADALVEALVALDLPARRIGDLLAPREGLAAQTMILDYSGASS